MVRFDWYILKFNFDLRNSANNNGGFLYNSGLGNSGDVIFMERCRTIMLRVGTAELAIPASGATAINARISSLFYTPSTQLTTAQATINAYAVYNSADACEKIIYSDRFPASVPQEPVSPSFSVTSVYSNTQLGQRDDYRFAFTMGNTATNSTRLVKLIGIELPPVTTYSWVLKG